ncbi:MAG: polysaccharide biosynthesis tyrosine autokinase [Cyanobacteria bacterium J06560_2]
MIYEERIEEIDLQRYWLVLKRRWRPAVAVFVLTLLAALAAAINQKPLWIATSKLLLRNNQTSDLTGVAQELGDLNSLKVTSDPLATQAEIIFSLPILAATIESLDLRNAEGELLAPSTLASELTVEPLSDTDLIAISYRSGDADLSAAVVNQIMASYVEANINAQRSEVIAAREFLEEELPRAQREADSLSEALKLFNEGNGIIALPEESSAAVSAIASIDNQINQIQVNLVEAASRAEQLSAQLGMTSQQARGLATLTETPAVQTALAQLQNTRAELATVLTRYTPRHPSVRALQRQERAAIDVLSSRVAEVVGPGATAALLGMSDIDRGLADQLVQAELNRASAYNQLSTLVQTRDAYQQQGEEFPRLKQKQTELIQRRDTAQAALENLRLRLQEVELADKQVVGSARVIEKAIPPSSATVEGKSKYVLAGAVVGTFWGVATAFFLDLIDRSLKTVKDGEKIFGYTTLGVIPRFELNKQAMLEAMALEDGMPSPRIVTPSSSYPILSGAYQMLQANLRFMSSDKKIKALVITSSVAGEGKSEVCANLAAAVAQTKRQVLLVDADMRSPNQHHLWNLMNTVGLSHVLVGEGSLEKALQPVTTNLTVLTAGVVPPNPMALLDSERMASLIERFRNRFDYIVFDTPSLSGSADAAVLGNLSDGVLMVMRPRHVPYDRALAAKTLLARSGARVLGMIANGVDSKNDFGEYSYDAGELTDMASRTALIAKERIHKENVTDAPVVASDRKFRL